MGSSREHKRSRSDAAATDGHRKHKKSKSLATAISEKLTLNDDPKPTKADGASDGQKPTPHRQSHPSKPQFPFYTQTVSLYEPIYPLEWEQPVTSCEYQHLQYLKNRYVASLKGILLDYKNVSLGAQPGRTGAAKSDTDPTTLTSTREYAVGYGWITADVDLFIPSRGAWMEGSINIQTEGHIGVVCFDKFNASIEAKHLPSSWSWTSSENYNGQDEKEAASKSAEGDEEAPQTQGGGFWVDEAGQKLSDKLLFRIRNFDIGTSDDATYLSLEGTMLSKEEEERVNKELGALEKARRGKNGGKRAYPRRPPEFALTRFIDEQEES